MNRLVKSTLLPLATSVFALALLGAGCAKETPGEDLKAVPQSASANIPTGTTAPAAEGKTDLANTKSGDTIPEQTMPSTVTAEESEPAETKPADTNGVPAAKALVKKPPSLEQAIAAPGDKKITAMSADGRTKVIEMGNVTLADTETYTLKATMPSSVSVGKESVISISLIPKTGWKINQEFPTKLKIVAPGGTSIKSATQSAKDAKTFSTKKAEFNVSFSATSAGVKNFTGKMRFAMCTDATCDPKSADIKWTLVAQ